MAVDVETFKKIYFQEFGVKLTDEEAAGRAHALMQVYKAVYGSPVITKDYGDKSKARH